MADTVSGSTKLWSHSILRSRRAKSPFPRLTTSQRPEIYSAHEAHSTKSLIYHDCHACYCWLLSRHSATCSRTLMKVRTIAILEAELSLYWSLLTNQRTHVDLSAPLGSQINFLKQLRRVYIHWGVGVQRGRLCEGIGDKDRPVSREPSVRIGQI